MKDLFGFSVTKEVESKELGGTLHYMVHNKTGAQLVWMDNGLDNKVFSITFKTLPENSTGVFHILEHTVLNGSEKFPVKEPFVDLLKSSMNTFLNAMTFSDKTMFPIASRNKRDFLNLTEVYLDAVFAPRILNDKNIFYQEGWHLEQDEDGKLGIKGVVYNEMRGAMADRDEIIQEDLKDAIFQDNCYGFNSGGDPKHVPDLSYEEFINTYKRFYHPSNSYIYLDGNIPVEETLKLIAEYLDRYEKSETLPKNKLQKPKRIEKTDAYALGPDEDEQNKACYSFGKIVADWNDRLKIYATDILCDALSSFNDAPITKAILDRELAQDVGMYVDDSVEQCYFGLMVKNIKDGKTEEVKQLIKDTVSKLVEEGLDHKLLLAYVNRMEFALKDLEEPSGIKRAVNSFRSWLYGGDPILYLESDKLCHDMRAAVDAGYFEKLLKEMFLDDTGIAELYTAASKTLSDEIAEEEKALVQKLSFSWTEKDFENNKKEVESLVKWQQTPDSKDDTDKLPKLPLSEVEEDPVFVDTKLLHDGKKNICTEVGSCDIAKGVDYIYHQLPSNGIIHTNLYFNLADFSIEELTCIEALEYLLQDLPTEKYSVMDLEREVKTYIGRISFKFVAYPNKEKTKCSPYFSISISCLQHNFDKAMELVKEILLNSKFADLKAIRDLVEQENIRCKEMGVNSGHALAVLCAQSGYGSDAAAMEAISGYTHIKFVEELSKNIDERLENFAKKLEEGLHKIICKSRLTISVTSSESPCVRPILEGLPEGNPLDEYSSVYETSIPKDFFYEVPTQIGYAAQCIDLRSIGEIYKGYLSVAAQIITYDYLWNEIRVQGGAYGTGLKVSMKGTISSYSFRDPTPQRSLEVNKGIGEHIRKLVQGDENFEKYIISTIALSQPLISIRALGLLGDADYFTGTTYEELKARRMEMLRTSKDDLLKAADILDKFAKEGRTAIVSHK